jgi:hypothetical protein
MNKRDNPYTPGAGRKPRTLAGRDEELESFVSLVERLGAGTYERSPIYTGLRSLGSPFWCSRDLGKCGCLQGKSKIECPLLCPVTRCYAWRVARNRHELCSGTVWHGRTVRPQAPRLRTTVGPISSIF